MNHQAHKAHQDKIQEPSADLDALAKEVVDSAFYVHKEIGPGLLESAYEVFLFEELGDRGIFVEKQKPLTVTFKNRKVDMAYKFDLVVEDKILIELKAVEKVLPIHEAQMLTYLRLSNFKLGFLINFNARLIKDGIRRFVL